MAPVTKFALLSMLVVASVSFALADDIDFLLAMAETVVGVNQTFPEWRRDNVSFSQSWPGVLWDPFNRSRIVGLPWDRLNCCGNTPVSGQNRPWVWNGTFPLEQFLTLTRLDHFYVSHTVNFIYNIFSNRTLTLPELRTFQIDGGSTRLALPDRWPAQLENVHFSQARLYGHGAGQLPPLLDSAGPSQLVEFECIGCALTCPLPQWLVDRIQSGEMNRCQLHTNYFEIINGKVCGQIAAESLNCVLVPTLKKPPPKEYFSTHTPDISFANDRVLTEFYGNSVYVFLKYFDTFSNQTKVYRDEYLGWVMQPWGLSPRGNGANFLSRMFELPKFTLIGSNPAKTIFNVSAVYGNTIEVEFTFFLGDPEPEVVRWDMRTSTKLNVTSGIEVVLSQEYLFRLQHSGNKPLGCLKQNTFLYTNCSSDVAEAYFYYPISINSLVMQFTNGRMSAQLQYPFTLEVDGRQLINSFTAVLPYAEPYGSVDRVQQFKRYYGDRVFTDPYPQMSVTAPDEQHVSVFALIYVPVWNVSLNYDPEFRLNLLFDPSSAAPAAPEVAAQEQAAMSAGIIAVIVIVVVVVAAISVFGALKLVIFPYYASRKPSQGTVPLDDEVENGSKTEGQRLNDPEWRASKKPHSIANA